LFTRSSIPQVAILIIVGLSVGHLARRKSPPIVDVRLTSEVPFNADPATGKRPSGPEVVMVFIGTPTCGFSTDPRLAPLVRKAVSSLRERVASVGLPLVSVGVSSNWVPGEGWRFLERIMDFDEVVIGRNWLNSKVVELGWSFPNAAVGTPQIIVYRQSVVSPSEADRASISREAPTIRVTGLDEIQRWVEAGCPLEWSSQSVTPTP